MDNGVLESNGPTPYDVAMQIVAHDRAMAKSRDAEAEARRSFLAREYDAFTRDELRDYAVRASEELIELRRRIAWYDDFIRSCAVEVSSDTDDGLYTQYAEVSARRIVLEREAALLEDAIRSLSIGH